MKPEGSKYNASIKWNIPCISKEWLIESLKVGRRLPVEEFSLDLDQSRASRIENNPGEVSEKVELKPEKPSTDNDQLISFDMSNRGASIMDGFDTVTRPNIMVDETQQGPPNRSSLMPMRIETVVVEEEDPTLNDISSGKRLERDFSSFNTMISKESTTTPVAVKSYTNNSAINKENNNTITTPVNQFDSPKFALDKSRFSFDFGEALEGMPSPAPNSQDLRRKSSRKSRGSLPIGIQFTEALQRAVDRHVPEEERAAMDKSFAKRVCFSQSYTIIFFY